MGKNVRDLLRVRLNRAISAAQIGELMTAL
jgi:hypothetical protein